MKNLIFTLLAAAAVCGSAFAEDAAKPQMSRADKMRLSQMKRFGGFLVHPTSSKGRIVIANAQTKYGDDQIARVIKSFTELTRVRVETVKSEKPALANVSEAAAKLDAQAVVFVTDDPAYPALLHAPEDGWAIVNVAKLAEGAADENVAKRRFRCELGRGLSYLSGAANSTFPGSLMTGVTAAKGLDHVSDEMPPVEVAARFPDYLKGFGITPVLKVSYRQACQEGWAPQPTNDFQKAIWNEVYAVPNKPIKIEKKK